MEVLEHWFSIGADISMASIFIQEHCETELLFEEIVSYPAVKVR